jgi:hypothetical protein
MSAKEPQARVARWRMKLMEYQFTIEYRPGPKNANPDALSRWPMGEPVEDEVDQEVIVVNLINFYLADRTTSKNKNEIQR